METAFDILSAKMIAIRAVIVPILRESVNEAAPVIEDKIIEQLKRGESGDGSMLPDYSPVSVSVYGKRPGPMTLEDTGDFHMAITVVADDSGIEIKNPNWKTPMLQMRYGDKIIDIQDDSFNELKPEILDDVIRHRIRNFIEHGQI